MMPPSADRPVSPLVRYRNAVREMIVGSSPALFVTLAFNSTLEPDAAKAKVRKLYVRWCRAALGVHWNKKVELWPTAVGVLEKPATNLHVHLLVACDEAYAAHIQAATERHWEVLAPSGTCRVENVYAAYGVADYVTKELNPDTQDRLFFLPSCGRT